MVTDVDQSIESDEALLRRYTERGEREAMGELLLRHHAAAWSMARSHGLGASDADDAVQAAFIAVLGAASSFAGRSTVRSWLLGIVINASRNLARSQRRRRAHEGSVTMPADSLTPPARPRSSPPRAMRSLHFPSAIACRSNSATCAAWSHRKSRRRCRPPPSPSAAGCRAASAGCAGGCRRSAWLPTMGRSARRSPRRPCPCSQAACRRRSPSGCAPVPCPTRRHPRPLSWASRARRPPRPGCRRGRSRRSPPPPSQRSPLEPAPRWWRGIMAAARPAIPRLRRACSAGARPAAGGWTRRHAGRGGTRSAGEPRVLARRPRRGARGHRRGHPPALREPGSHQAPRLSHAGARDDDRARNPGAASHAARRWPALGVRRRRHHSVARRPGCAARADLRARASSGDTEVRCEAVATLGTLGDPRIYPALFAAATGPDPAAAWWATRALSRHLQTLHAGLGVDALAASIAMRIALPNARRPFHLLNAPLPDPRLQALVHLLAATRSPLGTDILARAVEIVLLRQVAWQGLCAIDDNRAEASVLSAYAAFADGREDGWRQDEMGRMDLAILPIEPLVQNRGILASRTAFGDAGSYHARDLTRRRLVLAGRAPVRADRRRAGGLAMAAASGNAPGQERARSDRNAAGASRRSPRFPSTSASGSRLQGRPLPVAEAVDADAGGRATMWSPRAHGTETWTR